MSDVSRNDVVNCLSTIDMLLKMLVDNPETNMARKNKLYNIHVDIADMMYDVEYEFLNDFSSPYSVEYEIWSATSKGQEATFYGKSRGMGFRHACDRFFDKVDHYSPKRLTYKGFNLYQSMDEVADAGR